MHCKSTLWPSCDSAATSTVWNRRTKWYMAFCHCVMVTQLRESSHDSTPNWLSWADCQVIWKYQTFPWFRRLRRLLYFMPILNFGSHHFSGNVLRTFAKNDWHMQFYVMSYGLIPMARPHTMWWTSCEERESFWIRDLWFWGSGEERRIRVCMTSCLQKKTAGSAK